MKKYYRFAGIDICVEMPEDIFYKDPWNLTYFEVADASDPHTFRYEMRDELPAPEGERVVERPGFSIYRKQDCYTHYYGTGNYRMCAEHRDRNHHVLIRKNEHVGFVGPKTALECMELEHLIACNNGFLFHCSYIEHEGKAILFTAPSETGKSTQAELWHKHRGCEIINGDRAVIRLVDGVLIAEGIPFAGSSKYCKKRSLPIETIVYLAQAPETTIRRIHGYEAFSKIWEGVGVYIWEKEDVERVSAAVQEAAKKIPIFYLPCTPDESPVILLEDALRKLVNL